MAYCRLKTGSDEQHGMILCNEQESIVLATPTPAPAAEEAQARLLCLACNLSPLVLLVL